MKNIAVKVDGSSQVDASELNSGWAEEKNAVLDSGQSLLEADSYQISKASSINAAGADYYDDGGAANAYVLSKPGSSSLRSPPAYFEGMRIRFRPTNDNTGGSTVNVAAVGVVSILKADGVSALSLGDLVDTQDYEARYDISTGAFLLKPTAPESAATSKGLSFLINRRIAVSNNGVDDIDFVGAAFIFSDGTGSAVAPTYTKELDGNFVAGDAQGGLDTGAIAGDTTYHCYAVYNPSTGLSDYAFSLNASAPGGDVTAAGYTKSKWVWAIITDATPEIIPFKQVGNRCYWQTYKAALSYHPVDAAVPLDVPVDVPTGITVLALINAHGYNSSGTFNASRYYRIYSSALTSTLPVASATDFDVIAMQFFGTGDDTQQTRNNVSMEMLTDNATLKVVSITSSDGGYIDFITRGWIAPDL